MPDLSNGPLRYPLRLNAAWTCFMALAYGLMFAAAPTVPGGVRLAVILTLAVVSFVALRGYRWAVVIVLAVSLLMLVAMLPLVLLAAWKIAASDPLYHDSPGSMVVVAIDGLVFAVPPLLIVAMFARGWRELRSFLLAN